MKRKLLCFVLVLLCCTILFAGGGQEKGTTVPQGPKENTPIENAIPGYQFPEEKITLRYWHMLGSRPGFKDWLDKAVNDYQSIHPNVTIQVRDIPIQDFQTVFLAAMEAGTLPDLFTNQMSVVHAWGLAQPAPGWVTDIFETEYTDSANAYQKYSGSRADYQGKYLGWMIVELDCGMMLYYNKDILAEAGITEPPVTLEDFIDVAKKTTKYNNSGRITQGGFGIRYAGGPGGVLDKWLPIIFAFRDSTKGWAFNEDWSDVADWTGPEYVAATQFYKDAIWNWKIAATDMPAPEEAFKLGLVGMVHREAFLAGSLTTDAPDINYGIASLPIGAYAPGVKVPVQLSYVSRDAKNSDIAWDFNMFLNSDSRDLELAELTGSFPKRKTNEDSPYAQSIPYKTVFEAMYERPLIRDETLDPYGLYDKMADLLGAALEKIIMDPNANVEAELAAAKAKGHQAVLEAKTGR